MLTSVVDAFLLAVFQHPLPWHIDGVGGRPPHCSLLFRAEASSTASDITVPLLVAVEGLARLMRLSSRSNHL